MHRLTTVILACALPFAAWGESAADKAAPAWIERSNTYTNTLNAQGRDRGVRPRAEIVGVSSARDPCRS